MRNARCTLAVLTLPVLFSCAGPEPKEAAVAEAPPATSGDPAALRQEIESVNRQFVDLYNRDDVAGFASVYSDDATIYPPDAAPIQGREAIRQFWQGGHDQAGIRNVRLTTDEVQSSGDTAWETGRANFDTAQGPVTGKYVVIWKKTPEGWRWHRDIWNMNPPAQTS